MATAPICPSSFYQKGSNDGIVDWSIILVQAEMS